MARIRSIKPEFWSSEQVMECSRDARLLFIGLWNFSDDAGRHALSLRNIKAQVFPGDELSPESIRGLIDELSRIGLIETYEVDGKGYLQITGWHHQKIDKPQKPKHPPKPADTSPIARRMLAPDPILEDRKGVEGKGSKDAAPEGARSAELIPPQPTDEAELFRRGKAVLGKGAGGLIAKLLKAKGGSVAQARAAIEHSSEKQNPREYIGGVIRNKGPPDQLWDPGL